MSNNKDIIKISKEIQNLLSFLILPQEEADLVAEKLEKLLRLAEQEDENDKIIQQIIKLLNQHQSTREWMESNLLSNTIDSSRGEENLFHNAEDSPYLYPVWFGTNREPLEQDNLSKGFSNDRAKNFGAIYYGKCDVVVPESHKFGEIGNSWFDRFIKRQDDERLSLEQISEFEESVFWDKLKSTILETDIKDRDAIVFIHGFNNSFEDSAIRAAQIGFDLKIGHTAFFSWPSKAKVNKYPSDESTIIASEGAITEFLINFTKKSGANKVHIIAHSMGNRGLLAALKNISHQVKIEGEKIQFGQIILAAADLDVDLFVQARKVYIDLSNATTIYSSETDKAVKLSHWIHTEPRLGTSIIIEDDIDTISVSDEVGLFDLGHGYFSKEGALLQDIYELIQYKKPPENRQRPRKKNHENGKIYWLIKT